jgi:Holliday junction resolvase
MTEQQNQSNIIKRLEAAGWYVLKLVKTNKNGIPDLVALKYNDVFFVEVKTEKGVLSELQKYRIQELKNLKFKVEVKTNSKKTNK